MKLPDLPLPSSPLGIKKSGENQGRSSKGGGIGPRNASLSPKTNQGAKTATIDQREQCGAS